ncbi:MAG TPA: homoserine kinase [Terriglobales bacterium]|nr:homoserine kinase [Terriglobales bacterium]
MSVEMREQLEVTVPASIANLGPGFDTLAVAVQLYLRLKVKVVNGRDKLDFQFVRNPLKGENYIQRAFRFLARQHGGSHASLAVEVHSEIPMRSGLGSSAAATVAGLRLYEALYGPLPSQALLNAACTLEGHPDNAAAALFGGLTASCQLPDGSAYAAQFHWPEQLQFVVLTPDVALATSESRRVLPTMVPRSDAVFNLQRMALLLQLLQSGNFSLLRQALSDRLHQPFRQALVPGLEQALHLEHESVLGVCLSGAGPSIVAFAERDHEVVAKLLASCVEKSGIDFEVRTLKVHQADGESVAADYDPCTVCV